jgi:nucleotide-binding universal stress UspA family protein
MHRILIPVDGSPSVERVVKYLIGMINDGGLIGGTTEVHLVNVVPLLSPLISTTMSPEQLDQYYQARSDPDCHVAMALLEQGQVQYTRHLRIGAVAQEIAACAREQQCDSILMGRRGAGPLVSLLIGSVATKVLHLAEVPVTLVK